MTSRDENPYLARPAAEAENTLVVESSEEEHIQIRDSDGVLHTIGINRETILLNPITGERHFVKTKEIFRSSDNRLLLEPGKDQVFRCNECGAQNISFYSIAYCAGCRTPGHASCMHQIDDQQYLCPRCYPSYFWQRLKAWIFSIVR